MNLVMAIPTYWTWPDGRRPGEAVFDHPTPLDQEGTLARTLSSFSRLEDQDFHLVIVAAATSEELSDRVEAKVSEIIRSVDIQVPVTIFSHSRVASLREALSRGGAEGLGWLLGLDGYGPVRNLCLMAARWLEAEAVLLIDDDEVFEDPAFIGKVREGLEQGVEGLAGIYVNADGAYLMTESSEPWDLRWGKVESMNRAFRQVIGTGPRLKSTPFAFGGNMAMTRRLFTSVPFDPVIPRGEDIDYLINARIAGFKFQLDRELRITHLPPPHSSSPSLQLRQDVMRFLYEREKLIGAGLKPASFDPYPGRFLRGDLLELANRACELMADGSEAKGDLLEARSARQLASEIVGVTFTGAFDRFLDVQEQWRELMAFEGWPGLS